jgi:hypothetical protein
LSPLGAQGAKRATPKKQAKAVMPNHAGKKEEAEEGERDDGRYPSSGFKEGDQS